jgi:GH15 family glucan-1,4-alpha-glucosidase
MALPLEDYGLIGDSHAAGLVGRDGSIDWLCVPRFDSGACFAALIGTPDHGRWLVAPREPVRATRRRYRGPTLVLETEFDTEDGTVRLVDCMPRRSDGPDIVRLVEGVRGRVAMRMELVIRFDYGSIVPWVQRAGTHTRTAIGGPDALCFRTPIPVRGENFRTVAEFTVAEGDRVPFELAWYPSHGRPPAPRVVDQEIAATEAWWREWSAHCTYDGERADLVLRSLITLRALAYEPTGGLVAAPTTSLPECLGGVRNWDYRYCWLRDATFTLYAFMSAGFRDEARAWRDWLLRAAAGDPQDLQIMYGPAGERRLPELELAWLPGYEGARPVRVGNAACLQRQLDVYGELLDVSLMAARSGIAPDAAAWSLTCHLVEYLIEAWQLPDEGIWEVRGPRRHFTHSKVMAWVAMDRAVKLVERHGLHGPADRWRGVRDAIHRDVLAHGFDPQRRTFVQYYGSTEVDASLLMIPLVGFLPPTDPRVVGTLAAVERELVVDGFVLRYRTADSQHVDGLPPGEGAFLPCSFWLVDCLAVTGRHDEARTLFARLASLANDVGLLSEEYDARLRRLVGNFPQAFSHVSLVNSAINLSRTRGAAVERSQA